MTGHLVVLVTAESEAQARDIARMLLERQLAACVNLLPVRSLYVWEGDLHDDAEVLLIIKTTARAMQDRLIAAVKERHSYDVPEVLGLPVLFGAADYLRWIDETVAGDE